ncbi:hypothetical protein [Paenibacillus illinoisensis]|uniref:hypothetical protein n=1 Tax=Paenibacillus illinoisensis TaxID=59845 RepID=UPI00301D4D12
MKKLITFFSTLVIVSMIFGSLNVSADSSDEEVVLFEEEQITDIDALIERAKNGITDIPVNESNRSIVSLESNKSIANTQSLTQSTESDEFVVKEQYETTQKIKAVKKGNEITETFSNTSIAIMAQGQKYQTKPDSSEGVVAYSTVTYDTVTKNNLDTYKIIKVSGGWNRHDPTINMTDRKYRFGVTGNSFEGGTAVSWNSGTIETSLNAFQQNAPTSWGYVVDDSIMAAGVTSTITLSRGTSSKWELKLTNNL